MITLISFVATMTRALGPLSPVGAILVIARLAIAHPVIAPTF